MDKFVDVQELVLDNNALTRDFGYTPEKTSAEVFEFWRDEALS